MTGMCEHLHTERRAPWGHFCTDCGEQVSWSGVSFIDESKMKPRPEKPRESTDLREHLMLNIGLTHADKAIAVIAKWLRAMANIEENEDNNGVGWEIAGNLRWYANQIELPK